MKTIQERRLEILNWEKDNRNRINRSVNEGMGMCVYYGRIGCAVGRLIDDKDLCEELDTRDDASVSGVFSEFPENVQELGKEFLIDLQKLHDHLGNWTSDGLGEAGMQNYNRIKNLYCS